MDRLGFVDETVRQGRYGLVAVIVCHCQVTIVRKIMRGLVRPGQRRVRFSKQQDRDRRMIISQLVLEDIHALYVSARGRQTDARSKCWADLVPKIVTLGVTKLTIERQQGGEARDRRNIRDALLTLGTESDLIYTHEDPTIDPMLWVADAIAWCAGAGGPWLTRIASIIRR